MSGPFRLLTSANTTFIETVRNATETLHKELESVMQFDRFTRDRSLYRQTLYRFLSVWGALEDFLASSPLITEDSLHLESRFRKQLLVEDLLHLEEDRSIVGAVENVALPGEFRSDRGVATGVLYVMEGSTLGGRYISKSLCDHLGPETTKEVHFFNPYGEKNSQMWSSFLAWADTEITSDELPGAARGATSAFRLLINHFSDT